MSAARHPLWRMLAYVGRRPGLVALSVLTMVAGAGVDLLLPEIVKRTVDGPITGGEGGLGPIDGGPESLPWFALAATAATLMTSGPLLVAFLLFQRQFVQSFMRAGIK